MVGVTGIEESTHENTTGKILETIHQAGITLDMEDVSTSHRVGKPNRHNTRPREIIVRLKSADVKFHLVKNSRKLKNNTATASVHVNEDLTKFRDQLMYLGLQLFRNRALTDVKLFRHQTAKSKCFTLKIECILFARSQISSPLVT